MRRLVLVALLAGCGATAAPPITVAPVRDAPDPNAPDAAGHYATSGSLGACVVSITQAEHWESDMLMASPPFTDERGLTRLSTLLHLDIDCSTATSLARTPIELEAWAIARGQASRFGRTWPMGESPETPATLGIAAGEHTEADVILGDGPFLDGGEEVRAVLRLRAGDATTEIGTLPSWVTIAS
jgi:hypothetical protein